MSKITKCQNKNIHPNDTTTYDGSPVTNQVQLSTTVTICTQYSLSPALHLQWYT